VANYCKPCSKKRCNPCITLCRFKGPMHRKNSTWATSWGRARRLVSTPLHPSTVWRITPALSISMALSKTKRGEGSLTETDDNRDSKRQRRTVIQTRGPSAAVLRTMRLGTYFLSPELPTLGEQSRLFEYGLNDKSALEMARRLAALPPYVVPLQSVTLLDPHNNNDVTGAVDLSTWNATLVGLATYNQENCENNDSPLPWNLLPCLGLGLIRSIDVVQGLLYILTPIANPQRVNALIKSYQMSIPLEMMNRGVESESFPYVDFAAQKPSFRGAQAGDRGEAENSDNEEETQDRPAPLVLGTTPIQSRNNISRRRHQHRHRNRHHS